MEDKKFSLNTTYEWFEQTVGKSVSNAVSTFWENDFDIFLTSVNEFENIKDDLFEAVSFSNNCGGEYTKNIFKNKPSFVLFKENKELRSL